MTKAEREFNQGIRAFNRHESAPTDKRSALYAGWMAGKKIAALREKELQKMQARVMREARKKVTDAIAYINAECPEQLEKFRTEIENQFQSQEVAPPPVASEDAPAKDAPAKEGTPRVENALPVEPAEDRRELVKTIKDRFRRQFGFTAMTLQEVNAKFVRRTLSAHFKELPIELQGTDESFWMAADKLMDELAMVPA